MLELNPDNLCIWSDTHFWHTNIIKYCGRPYRTVEGMNAFMLRQMVAADRAGKVIIHLGDFKLGGKSSYVPPLAGAKQHKLLPGNHDYHGLDSYAPWFGEVLGRPDKWETNAVEARIGDTLVVLSHNPLPITPANLEQYQWNLHGHVHANSLSDSWHVNCSVEVLDYHPMPWFELLRRLQ